MSTLSLYQNEKNHMLVVTKCEERERRGAMHSTAAMRSSLVLKVETAEIDHSVKLFDSSSLDCKEGLLM